ncbi:Uncharacterized protein GBIM_15015, partial [Gryllus bimaculatus]
MDVWVCLLELLAVVVAFKIWYKWSMGRCTSKRRLNGLTAIVTGANTGIGLETAKDLARRGARVLLACRDPQRGQKALEEVLSEAGDGATVALLALDLASLESVRACAKHVLATEPRLDILVNHFGPFLFTLLLVDLLKKSAPSRIIFVSSLMHHFASLKPHQLEHEHAQKIDDTHIYSMTKLANVIVANELARKLRGTGVAVNSLHPGLVRTEFFRHLPPVLAFALNTVAGLFCKDPVEGAQTTIHLAVSEDVEGVTGRYFSDCKKVWRPMKKFTTIFRITKFGTNNEESHNTVLRIYELI